MQVEKLMLAFDIGLEPHMLKTAMRNLKDLLVSCNYSKIRIFFQSCFSDNYLKEKTLQSLESDKI